MVVPCTTDANGAITGVGTPVNYDSVTDTTTGLTESSAAKSTEFVQVLLDNGVTVEIAKKTKVLDMATGDEKTGGSGGSGDTLGFSTPISGKTAMQAIAAFRGVPCLVVVGLGETVDAAERGAAFLLGTVGKVDRGTKGEEVVVVKLDFTGGTYTATAPGSTALAFDPAAITPVGGSPVDLPGLVAADLTALLAGQLVVK